MIFSDLPLGGSFCWALAYSRELSLTRCSPSGLELTGSWIEDELGEREPGQGQQDHGGADGPTDLKARIAMDLGGDSALARAEAEQGVAERSLDQHEDHERYIQRDLVEAVDLVGVGRPARWGVKNARGVASR